MVSPFTAPSALATALSVQTCTLLISEMHGPEMLADAGILAAEAQEAIPAQRLGADQADEKHLRVDQAKRTSALAEPQRPGHRSLDRRVVIDPVGRPACVTTKTQMIIRR